MSNAYHVYANDGADGPVNFASPIGTTSSLSFLTDVLTYPGDYTFVVRTYDTVTGFEDLNSEGVRLILDASGNDITHRPPSPDHLAATQLAAGGLLVEWSYLPVPGSTPPTGFRVWASTSPINYASTPTATTLYSGSTPSYAVTLSGLTGGSTYNLAVRAYNATAEDGNTVVITAVPDASGPLPVVNLAAYPTF